MVVFEIPLPTQKIIITREHSCLDLQGDIVPKGTKVPWNVLVNKYSKDEIEYYTKEGIFLKIKDVKTVDQQSKTEPFNSLTQEQKNTLIECGFFSRTIKQKVGIIFCEDGQFEAVYKKHGQGKETTRVITVHDKWSILKENETDIPSRDTFKELVKLALLDSYVVNEEFLDEENKPEPFSVLIPACVRRVLRTKTYGIRTVDPAMQITEKEKTGFVFHYNDKPPQRQGYFIFDKIIKSAFEDVSRRRNKIPELFTELNNTTVVINQAGKIVDWRVEITHFYPTD